MGEYSAILPNNQSPHQSFFINPNGSFVQQLNNKDRARSKTLNNILTSRTRTLGFISEDEKLSPVDVESKSLYGESDQNDHGPFEQAEDDDKYDDSFMISPHNGGHMKNVSSGEFLKKGTNINDKYLLGLGNDKYT